MDVRRISQVITDSSLLAMKRTALDSHADTCCAGSNMAVLDLTGEKVNVLPFSDTMEAV